MTHFASTGSMSSSRRAAAHDRESAGVLPVGVARVVDGDLGVVVARLRNDDAGRSQPWPAVRRGSVTQSAANPAARSARDGAAGPPPEPGLSVPVQTVSATVMNGDLVVRIDATSPLAMVGGVALTQVAVGNLTRFFLLARLTPETCSALNAVCTHEGCTVSRFARPLFVCPCHGSQYTTNGEVVRGPAPAALPRYRNDLIGGVLTVQF